MNRKRVKTGKRIRKIDRYDFKASVAVVLLIVLFCCYSFILVCQRSAVNNLDSQIRQLTNDYEEAVKINDDLQGKLIKESNLPQIEYYAVNVLGMVKPASDSVTYVCYEPQNETLSAQATADAGDSTFAAWLNTLFK